MDVFLDCTTLGNVVEVKQVPIRCEKCGSDSMETVATVKLDDGRRLTEKVENDACSIRVGQKARLYEEWRGVGELKILVRSTCTVFAPPESKNPNK